MTSPFQQVNSGPSEHQRKFERIITTLPSWLRSGRSKPDRSGSKLLFFMMRQTLLWLTGGKPAARNSRFSNAAIRR